MSSADVFKPVAPPESGGDLHTRFSNMLAYGGVVALVATAFALPSGGPALHGLAAALLVGLLATAVVIDLRYRRIPNKLTYTVAGMAVVVNAVATLLFELDPSTTLPVGAIGLGPSLAGLGACLGVMLVARAIAGVGGGDVKLAAAVGALVGPGQGLTILFVSHLVAALCVGGWMFCRFVKSAWQNGERRGWLHWVYSGGAYPAGFSPKPMYVPMAPYFAVATVLALL